ncbi:MAG: TrmH family RNA methyltransferase [Spirochaetes bacterium]|nr:TrmH family RNA methyltransferase [Spirochaetota bacterium]
MMALSKLSRLHGVALERKCALLLEAAERDIAVSPGYGGSGSDGLTLDGLSPADSAFAYAAAIAAFLAASPEASPEAAAAARVYSIAIGPGVPLASHRAVLRSLNTFRHELRLSSGQSTADWDLIDRGRQADTGSRLGRFIPGLRVFLEDIRSPFNVGAIMRSAEAFGFEEALLSPGCADPNHPRAARSSMGAVNLIPWRRCALADLSVLGPIVALELGGTTLDDFVFPPRGVLILGSEELGLSDPALGLAGDSRVSIPMLGLKASINVAVAFGIAAHAWISSCTRTLISR